MSNPRSKPRACAPSGWTLGLPYPPVVSLASCEFATQDAQTHGDYRLLPGSPCIDAGSNAAVPVGVATDLDRDGDIDQCDFGLLQLWLGWSKLAPVPGPGQ